MSKYELTDDEVEALAESLANLQNDNPTEADFAAAEAAVRRGEVDDWVADLRSEGWK